MLGVSSRKKYRYYSALRFFEACTCIARFLAVCPSCEHKKSKWSNIRHIPALLAGPVLSYLSLHKLPPAQESDGSTRTLFALEMSESVIVGHSYLVCFAILNSRIGSLRSSIVKMGATGAILPSPSPAYDIIPLAVYDLALLAAAVWFHVFFPHGETTVRIIDYVITFRYTTPFILLHLLTSPLRALLVIATVQARSLKSALTNPPPSALMSGKYYAEALCRLQWRIYTAVSDLSDAFSFNMFLSASLFFLIAVYNLYDILTFNLQSDNSNNLGWNITGVIWIAFWGVDIACLAYLAETLSEQFEEFNVKLHGLVVEDMRGVYSDSKKLLLQVTMQSIPKLSAAGFFTIDYGLLLSMTSSAGTYLIILIQFFQLKIVNSGSNLATTDPTTLENFTVSSSFYSTLCTSTGMYHSNQSGTAL